MKHGILFDLDGTLWDATSAIIPAWNAVLKRHGSLRAPLTREDMRGYMGKTSVQIAALMLPGHPIHDSLAIVNACCEEELPYLREQGGCLYPHITETLAQLRQSGYFLYIVSNCQDGYIEAFLQHHRLAAFFEDYEYEGRTGRPKGENIRLVMERHGLDRAVYIGDTQGDLEAADVAGIPFIHAAYGFGRVDRALPVIREPRDLLKQLCSFF